MGKKNRKNNANKSPKGDVSSIAEGLRRMGQNHRDSMMKESQAELDSFDHLTLDEQKSTIRGLLQKIGTDVAKNDASPTGSGDQSRIQSEERRDVARKIYTIGGDIYKHMSERALSDFAAMCLFGDVSGVRKSINDLNKITIQRPRSKEMEGLLETRETSLRLSPLLLLVSAGKNVRGPQSQDLSEIHIQIAKILLKAGACPTAQDVLGKTACHYGAGAFATDMTLAIVTMCIRAAASSMLYRKDVELHGLKKSEMNGIKGVAGGDNPDTDRRVFYYLLEDTMKEVWVKPINMRLVKNNEKGGNDDDGKEKPLTDVQDRLGSVSLHEVVMQDRYDVAEFLLFGHSTSIHTEDADGMSPLKMATECGSIMSSRVSKLIFDKTRKEGKQNNRTRTCATCQTNLGTKEGMECIGCKTVLYCSKECQVSHWKNGHKAVCESLKSVAAGVRLKKPSGEHGHTISMRSLMSHTRGSYRIPDGVKPGEKFVIKVQGGGDMMPIMVYDQTRTCEFVINPGQPGFREVLVEIRREMAWQGRKTFMKASFEDGDCTVYPSTAGVKVKYSW